jgi:hypothetical protein
MMDDSEDLARIEDYETQLSKNMPKFAEISHLTCTDLYGDILETIVDGSAVLVDLATIVVDYMLKCGIDDCSETCYLDDSRKRLTERRKNLVLKPCFFGPRRSGITWYYR